MELVKEPVPVPSVVCEPEITGLAAVDQQIPRAVTAASPPAVTLPPEEAVVVVMDEAAVVVTVGGLTSVVNCRSVPYEVPFVLVA